MIAPTIRAFLGGDVEPLMIYGNSPPCRSGATTSVRTWGQFGISGAGGLSERIVVEERWVLPVGDMPLDQAAMIEPLAVAEDGVRFSGAQQG